jgi:hypothetical protein
MAADIVFDRAAGADAQLVFGDLLGPAPSRTASASINLGGVRVRALVAPPVKASASVLLGGITVAATAFYDNRVTPWKDFRAAIVHNPALCADHSNSDDWQISLIQRGGKAMRSGKATQRPMQAQSAFDKARLHTESRDARWQLAIQKAQVSSTHYQKAVFKADGRAEGWQLGDDRRVGTASAMESGIFKVLYKRGSWQTALATLHQTDHPAGASLFYSGVLRDLPWELAGFPAPGHSAIEPPKPPKPPSFWWGADLLFQCPPLLSPALVFGDTCIQVPTGQSVFAILPARFYMTAHTIYAQTLPDLADVPIYEATVAADSGSYCWSLSASGPASLFEQLAPVGGLPAQIKLTLDGIPWVFAVDSISRSASFGQTGVRIQGRSVTALIAAPYLRATTRSNATDQTAQQIALEALTGTGVALDWGMGAGALANGGLVDWLIPAGAWSHQSTPLDAVQTVVQAAGGYLQSHRSSATLQARHPYGQRVGDVSGAPWNWSLGAADVELATDALITESVQRQDGSDINAVYVSGTTAGVLALVKRSGSAADKLAQMLTDPLITHADAARQRGLSVLGGAGHKYAVTLELPVLTGTNQPGVLDVGQLVQVNASEPWRARVRSVSVAAKRPSLRQTVTLERHLEAV